MIYYVKGDATQPKGDGKKIIAHICNNIGAWGAGFVLAITKRWIKPEESYRGMRKKERQLGVTQLVNVQPDIWVANMIAQEGTKSTAKDNTPPIRYGALRVCLAEVNDDVHRMGATIHMPRIGCGLAGGKWEEVEKILKDTMSVDVYVYDFV